MGGKHADALAARELGFYGKLVFHPHRIAPIDNAFTPEAAARCKAVALLDRKVATMDLIPREKPIITLAAEAAAL